jgi:Zn-dependent protease with chaperone function
MSTIVLCTQYFVLAAASFLALGILGSAALASCLRERVLRQEPRERHRMLVLLTLLPVLAMAWLLLSACLPSLLSLLNPELDHCPRHDDGHPHLCFVHLPTVGLSATLVWGLFVLTTYAVSRVGRAAWAMLRAMRAYRTLADLGEPRPELGITVLDMAHPVCLAAGLLRPRVLFSRGLFHLLDDEERAVVLTHEAAHVRRRDALVTTIARACSALQLPWIGSWLVKEIEIAAEQVCDEEASLAVGDRVLVASAILSVERAVRQSTVAHLSPIAVAFGQCAVERRVLSLLAEPTEAARPHLLGAGIGVFALVIILAAVPLHHITEFLLSFVLH